MHPSHRLFDRHPRGRATAFVATMAFVLAAVVAAAAAPGTRTITFADLMKFRAIDRPAISHDGSIVAFGARPDRGDGEGVVHHLASGRTFTVARGAQPMIARDGRVVVMAVQPSFAETENAGADRPKPGMAVLDTASGHVTTVERVERFALSEDGRWLAYLMAAEPAPKGGTKPAAKPTAGASPERAEKRPGTTLTLRNLVSGAEVVLPFVTTFAFDPSSKFLAYAVADGDWTGNGVFVRSLAEAEAVPSVVTRAANGRYDSLVWTGDGLRLAVVGAIHESAEPGPASLWIWDSRSRAAREAVAAGGAIAGWHLPFKTELVWSRDGARLFVGLKPGAPAAASPAKPGAKSADAAPDPYDFERLLNKVELDVWHWQDARIQTQQKIQWNREKDRTYRAVLHVDRGLLVALGGPDLPDVEVPENATVALATTPVPYLREATWDEGYRDVFVVNLADGMRTQVARKLTGRAALSPDGRTVAYFNDRAWFLYDIQKRTTVNVTSRLGVAFDDEWHDTPSTAPAHGLGGWVDRGAALIVYDRYDVWQIPVGGGAPVNLTGGEGRRHQVTFRLVQTDPDESGVRTGEPLLLTAYHEREKNWGFWSATAGRSGVSRRIDEPKRFRFVAKAKGADLFLYTRESYDEFPDLWVADSTFRQPRKVSNANPQLAEFAWGSAELVEYASADGTPLQGVLIKPANYEPGRRYPVITYFYERQSQRLYEFNEPVVNHRPSFAVYAGAGYAVFLPDIVFEVGYPGQSILKCVVPGVQKLVDKGIADPNALGIHGHSWGGYGTAYLVTQTTMFKAAVAGAPVANMTSAYGGIRWESGLARLFQYERTQSRIGGSLWEYPLRYIENSALFSANRVTTPLLIQHGDEDGAVPWYQAIELYLAMRRLGKPCIFLQYRGEPHHLRKYPNKLDYSIKMKEYFDHYLKGAPAPAWISEGVPYSGK
jgi:dipeptidyl aminopeptidase/acylaminoacyl peptidase